MTKYSFFIFIQFILSVATAQEISLNKNWQFRQAGKKQWYKAVVPGCVHADLYNNKLIADPFFADNETRLQWIDQTDWEYKTSCMISKEMLAKTRVDINFEGLDTYADVYVNNRLLLKADNMFRYWTANAKPLLRPGRNELRIYFHSVKKITDSIAKANLPLVLPDNNRVYARKAQYQFGWDWGPKFIGAGIWKQVTIYAYDPNRRATKRSYSAPAVQLIQQKDSIGTSFHFEKDGKPFFVKGANWIPAHAFPASAKRKDYRELLVLAKEAGMNMLRVWGGGIYESDDFYELCDSLGIMVWQDFMFAGGMYPGDENFFASVKAEVADQVRRLRKYDCIVLWCGNNEIDEAWHHWGWQNQFNLHGNDSALVWNNYEALFKDSLRLWLDKFDGRHPYISTSPQYGWGNPMSYKNGDSHYWGLWWGLEGWEKFKTHTGRFVSEWGMQAMPDYSTVEKYTAVDQRYINSPAVKSHQKANDGFKKLNHYIHQYFFDTTQLGKLSLKEYTYLTQCLQYYILKNSIATQMSKQPVNMGTLLWQLNDCWPVTSWSIIDFYKNPKAGYYAVKHSFTSMDTTTDKVYPKTLKLEKPAFIIGTGSDNGFYITSNVDAKYVYIDLGENNKHLSDNYFDLDAGEKKFIPFRTTGFMFLKSNYKIMSLYDILSK